LWKQVMAIFCDTIDTFCATFFPDSTLNSAQPQHFDQAPSVVTGHCDLA